MMEWDGIDEDLCTVHTSFHKFVKLENWLTNTCCKAFQIRTHNRTNIMEQRLNRPLRINTILYENLQ